MVESAEKNIVLSFKQLILKLFLFSIRILDFLPGLVFCQPVFKLPFVFKALIFEFSQCR